MSNVMIWGGTRGLGRQLAEHALTRDHHVTVTGRRRPEDLAPDIEFAKADFSVWPPNAGGDDWALELGLKSVQADILFWVAGHWLRKSLGSSGTSSSGTTDPRPGSNSTWHRLKTAST